MSSAQIEFFGIGFIGHYRNESLEDLVMAIRLGLRGEAEKEYRGNVIDSETLHNWMKVHLSNKAGERERIHHVKKMDNLKVARKYLKDKIDLDQLKLKMEQGVVLNPTERSAISDKKVEIFGRWGKFKDWYERRYDKVGKNYQVGYFDYVCPVKKYVEKHMKRFYGIKN